MYVDVILFNYVHPRAKIPEGAGGGMTSSFE